MSTVPRKVREFLPVRVECYAGSRGEETPRRFHAGGGVVEVVEVAERWLAPEYRYFKVRGDDEATYILRHDQFADHWDLVRGEGRGVDSAPPGGG